MEYRLVTLATQPWMSWIVTVTGIAFLFFSFKRKRPLVGWGFFAGCALAAICPVAWISILLMWTGRAVGDHLQLKHDGGARRALWSQSLINLALLILIALPLFLNRTWERSLLRLESAQLITGEQTWRRTADRSSVAVTAVADGNESPSSWNVSGNGIPKDDRVWLLTDFWYRSSDGRFMRGDKVAQEVAEWAQVEIGHGTWEEANSP